MSKNVRYWSLFGLLVASAAAMVPGKVLAEEAVPRQELMELIFEVEPYTFAVLSQEELSEMSEFNRSLVGLQEARDRLVNELMIARERALNAKYQENPDIIFEQVREYSASAVEGLRSRTLNGRVKGAVESVKGYLDSLGTQLDFDYEGVAFERLRDSLRGVQRNLRITNEWIELVELERRLIIEREWPALEERRDEIAAALDRLYRENYRIESVRWREMQLQRQRIQREEEQRQLQREIDQRRDAVNRFRRDLTLFMRGQAPYPRTVFPGDAWNTGGGFDGLVSGWGEQSSGGFPSSEGPPEALQLYIRDSL